VIDGRLAQYPSEDRIVVYYRTINEIQRYAGEIGGVTFYSGVGDIERKRKIIRLLTEGEERVF
jgi:hypothetical protein